MTGTVRKSVILFDVTAAILTPQLRKDNSKMAQDKLDFWTTRVGRQRRGVSPQFSHAVFIPRLFRREIGGRTAARLLETAKHLIVTNYPLPQPAGRFPIRRRHVQDIHDLNRSFSGFKISRGQLSFLEKKLAKIVRLTEIRIKFINIVQECDGSFSDLKRATGKTTSKLLADIKSVVEEDSAFNKKVVRLNQMIALARAVFVVSSQHQRIFSTLNDLEEEIRIRFPHLQFTKADVYRTFRMHGYRWKSNIVRSNQTDSLKDARCWFLKEYLYDLSDADSLVFYFDWSSFSEKNFQSRSWSATGAKSIVNNCYVYCKLHLFAVLGPDGVEAMQFVSGTLHTAIVFEFLLEVMGRISRRVHNDQKNVVLVLDNSPMNHSVGLKNYAASEMFTLLYTAPNSSFLNPIEYLFAKCKAGLKTKTGCSK